MTKHVLQKDMTFVRGRAMFFAKAREGVIYPLGNEKTHVIDGHVVGGGGTTAYFKDHLWSTDVPEYAAGMITMPHFMDHEGYIIDPRCLPHEVLDIWGQLDRKGKQNVCLALVNGEDPADAVASVPIAAAPDPVQDIAPPETFVCPVSGCGVAVDNEPDPAKARAALIVHVRLMHPDWEG